MLTITPNIYRAVADRVINHIADSDYFNGTVEYEDEELYSTLRVTLIIYHELNDGPDTPSRRIADIVPVWWEFATFQQNGQRLNDFSWTELKKHLI